MTGYKITIWCQSDATETELSDAIESPPGLFDVATNVQYLIEGEGDNDCNS